MPKLLRKFVAITSIGLILLQSVLPILLPWSLARATYAQEATDSLAPNEAVSEVGTSSAEIVVEPTPTPTPIPEWQTIDGIDITSQPVAEGHTYRYRDTAVSVTFTKITQPDLLRIKEVKLTPEQMAELGAVSDTAYDITSDMPDGTFVYDLTLPNPQPNQEAKVQYSEDGQTYQDLPAEKQNDLLIIKNLDHFTIFVVTNPSPPPTNYLQDIVDNSDPGFEIVSGTWRTSTSVSGYYGSNYITTDDHTGIGEVRWNFTPTQSGTQEIFTRWTAAPNRGTTVPFTVIYDGGSTTVPVNQELDNGTWVSLGTYLFTAGNPYSVTLTNNSTSASDFVVGDAIKIQNVSDPVEIWVDDSWTGTSAGTDLGSGKIFGYSAFSTIQNGIDAIAAGGTVNIADGSYTESVNADVEGITLSGESTSGVIISAGASSTGISVLANNVTIKNLTVDSNGDGISLDSVSGVTIQDSTITNNTFAISGIYILDSSDISVTGNTITGNSVGLDLTGTTSGVTATGNVFGSNTDFDIANSTNSDVTATGNTWDMSSGIFVPKILDTDTSPASGFAGQVIFDLTNPSVDAGSDKVTNAAFIQDATATDDYDIASFLWEKVSGPGNVSFSDAAVEDPEITADADGIYDIKLTATDTSGNQFSDTFQLTWNTVAPTIGPVTLATDYDPYVRGNGFTIRADVSDSSPGIDTTSCEYTIDGVTWSPATYVAATSRCRASSLTAPDGTVLTLNLRVKDLAGNPAEGIAISRIADRAIPVTSGIAISPDANGYTNGTPMVTASITDSVSPITACEYRTRITGSGAAGWSVWNSATWSGICTANPSGLADNTSYDFQIRGDDSTNHTSSSTVTAGNRISRSVDTNAPSSVPTSPAPGYYNATTWPGKIEGTATDNTSSVTLVEVSMFDGTNYWNGIDWTGPQTWLASTGTDTWDYSYTPSKDGEFTFYSRATDSAGNVESTGTLSGIFYDTTPPTLEKAETQDADGNGNIDAIRLTFSEAIDDSRLNPGADGWDVADPAGGEQIGTGEPENDNVLILTFGEGPTPDTANTPTVTYTASGGLSTHDLAGNELESGTWPTTDGAPPVLLSAETRDSDVANGHVDQIIATFSEDLDSNTVSTGNFDVGGYTVNNVSVSGNEVTLFLDEQAYNDVGYKPSVSVFANEDDESVQDPAGNAAADKTVTAQDKAAPLSTITTPENDSVHKSPIDISGSSSDGQGDTVNYVRLYYRLHGEEEDWTEMPESQRDNEAGQEPYEWAFDWTPDEDGVYDIKAEATDDAGNVEQSPVVENVTYDATAPDMPMADPAAGDYFADQSVTLSSSDVTSGMANIYYTTDETEPDDTSSVYGDPINIGQDTTLKAIAYDNAGNASEVLTAVYGIAPMISDEASSAVGSSSVTVTWTTDDPATSRVIYDTVSHTELGAAPNYGYANSTVEADTDPKVIDHSVVVSGLSAGTTYYYRTVSHGSPEAVSDEQSFSTSSSGGGDGGGGGTVAGASDGGAPACGDTKPSAAPTLTAAVAGVNTITLFWSKAGDPVSYYLVTYGATAGAQTYGNPNVGGAGTSSYTVAGLSGGTTYYFKVRAGNGCMPGDYSNEISATPTGGFVAGPAAGFAAGVLGETTEEVKGEATRAATPEVLGGEKEEQGGGAWWWVFWGTIGLGGLGVIFFLRRRGQLG